MICQSLLSQRSCACNEPICSYPHVQQYDNSCPRINVLPVSCCLFGAVSCSLNKLLIYFRVFASTMSLLDFAIESFLGFALRAAMYALLLVIAKEEICK